MKDKITISANHIELTKKLEDYINKKMMKLVRYIPRKAKQSLKIEVRLRENKSESTNKYEAEALFNLPDKTITAKDSTINIFAAVDILESKLKQQLQKYKSAHTVNVAGKRIAKLRRLLGRYR